MSGYTGQIRNVETFQPILFKIWFFPFCFPCGLGSLGPVCFTFHLWSSRIRFRTKDRVLCGERNKCGPFKRAVGTESLGNGTLLSSSLLLPRQELRSSFAGSENQRCIFAAAELRNFTGVFLLLLLVSFSPLPPFSPVSYSSLNLIVVLTATRVRTFLGSFSTDRRREEYVIPKHILGCLTSISGWSEEWELRGCLRAGSRAA